MYELVEIHGLHESTEGFCRWGYAIYKENSGRISSNLYRSKEEAENRVEELNDSIILKEFWPNAHEDEVRELLTDSDFYPIVKGEFSKESSPLWRVHKACEQVARNRANQ